MEVNTQFLTEEEKHISLTAQLLAFVEIGYLGTPV
jgi:hypothetical protein